MIISQATVRHISQRIQQVGWASAGRQATRKVARLLLDKWALAEPELPLRPGDIVDSAQESRGYNPAPATGPLNIGWVCAPPGPGSGGHTTLFRMVRAMETRGHHCTLFLYDRNSDDSSRHEETIRRHWPDMNADVRSATHGLEGVDALVASSWASAHVIAARAPRSVHPFYFIQDYEPYFYPRGALYALAEDSYRFGFTNIALGAMIAEVMQFELGQAPEAVVPYGCDTSTYHLIHHDQQTPRSGVVYYAKRNVDRRGYLLAKLALELFHEQCPDQEIHVYGDVVTGWQVPVINHGNLPPKQLNGLYNQTIAGLAISFTNISLVPGELLSAGNVPVLNQAPFASGLLTDPDAVWAPSTPGGLAAALTAVVRAPNINLRAATIANRKRLDWDATGEAFADVLHSTCAGARREVSQQ
ncbi:glycosyltransferase family 1 protein [Arthrobacter sp. 31Y]|uniref:glycosyltransferase family 1 protein n=1 Tax=Arthrobacter sp. 31Y TaxID=1115632 RepID=UPI0004645259|nr:glycosyltransferase family 1 protein [Arthrobacter sp. 31Y]